LDPLLYQYGVGGIVFGAGLWFAWRQGYVGTSGKPLRNLILALGGLALVGGLQAWLQYGEMPTTEAVPYKGGWERKPQLGTKLDYAIMVGYFVAMLAIGTWFGRNNKGTKDFFFGGQRFSWWLIAFSLVATVVGSYSFVKYSKIAYTYGIASSQTYLNDWLWMPLLLFGWLPILYFSRIVSIPEYFERRFGRRQRQVATWLLLLYLVGYVGLHLFTMGKALHTLLGWPIFASALLVASISAIYVTFGGQTSVIMTDLFQGVMLLLTGLVLLLLGVAYLGGFGEFWDFLPRGHRQAFPDFNADASYPAVGIFWQDAMANSAMFYFLNQGIVMRLLAARSVEESRKATIAMMLILMPIAAIVVASGGWVARALVASGDLPDMDPGDAFFIASEFLTRPGMFGLVMAALTAALMSTVDTLITAIAAIVVNDIYSPKRPDATDGELLKVARISSVSIAVLGVGLVPIFATFDSIYSAHGAFTAAVTPPLVVALLLGVFWRRFTPAAATATMVGGSLLIAASILWPEMITPFAHGVPMKEVAPDVPFAGKNVYKFMRAFFGLVVCGAIGVTVTMATKARPLEQVKGLVWGTVSDAIAWYKGRPGVETEGAWADATPLRIDFEELQGRGRLPTVSVSRALGAALGGIEVGDLVYVSDARAYLGGLRSGHAIVADVLEADGAEISIGPRLWAVIDPRPGARLKVRKLY